MASRSSSSTGSSSASPATPATACSSPATASPETAAFGNDLSTLPDFPAEIRAPAGTLPGVSAFQLHFADHDIMTPGDAPDVLVAMNPAALKANIARPAARRDIIVNTDEFTTRNLAKVGYDANPLDDGSLDAYNVHPVALTVDDRRGAQGLRLTRKDAERAKNMFALGLLSWLYNRPTDGTIAFLETKFAARARHPRGQHRGLPGRLELRRDHRGLRRSPTRSSRPRCRPAPTATSPATSRWPTAWSPPSQRAGLPLFLGSYPITPASDILHELASTSASASRPSRPRTRSPASAPRWARPSAAPSA